MATPSVRKLARDNNVDISKVVGTGPGGRILENDIMSSRERRRRPRRTGSKDLRRPGSPNMRRDGANSDVADKEGNSKEHGTLMVNTKGITHMDLINATNLFNK